MDTKRKATEKILTKYPELKPFECHSDYEHRISNFGPADRRGNPSPPNTPVDRKLLREIFKGIPKPYPFWSACVALDQLEAFDLRSPQQKVRAKKSQAESSFPPLIANLELESHWDSRGRRLHWQANILLNTPDPESEHLEPLPDTVMEKLARLGSISINQLLVTDEEDSRYTFLLKGQPILEKYKRDPWHGFKQSPEILQFKPGPISGGRLPGKKELMKRAFEPLGYKNVQEYEFKKFSKRGNLLTLEFDYAPMTDSLMGWLGVSGLSWGGNLDLCECTIHDHQTLVSVIEDCAALLKAWEETAIPELEALGSPMPRWYANEMMQKK